jgi:hypothetical protein
MDCPRPSYTPDEGCNISESLHYYQEWKHSCYLTCLAPVLDAISQPTLDYDTVLDLDKRIRDFSIPTPLRNKDIHSRSIVMQRASLEAALEAVLLQLHRQFFTRALSGPEEAFNRRHKYAPSVVAVFLSASRMIANVQELYSREPHLTARILGYWSNAFSAAVALCLLVSRAPFTCLSPAALQELERARILFRAAKETCPRAQQVLPVLETMIDKANYIFNCWSTGQELPTVVLRHITDDNSFDSEPSSGMQGGGGSIELTSVMQYSQQSPYVQHQQLTHPQSDSFGRSHRSLAQCIVEVHQRAKALFPLRKPCQCSAKVSQSCPPSHSWTPVPNITSQTSPVLPDIPFTIDRPRMSPAPGGYSALVPPNMGMNTASRAYSPATNGSQHAVYGMQNSMGEGIYSNTVLPIDGPAIPPPLMLSPSSKMAVVDTINFELGALQSNSDQALMAFF